MRGIPIHRHGDVKLVIMRGIPILHHGDVKLVIMRGIKSFYVSIRECDNNPSFVRSFRLSLRPTLSTRFSFLQLVYYLASNRSSSINHYFVVVINHKVGGSPPPSSSSNDISSTYRLAHLLTRMNNEDLS
ncbi:hypothetical protein ACFE04_006175 [Oxalis oulophora]